MPSANSRQKRKAHNDSFFTVSALIGVLLKKARLGGAHNNAKSFFEQIRTKQTKLFYKAMT